MRVDATCTDSYHYLQRSVASLVSIVIASSFVYRDIENIFARNMATVAYISLVVISVAWSIHPDLTFQRAIGGILSMLVAAYLSVRFGEKDRMKVLSLFLRFQPLVRCYSWPHTLKRGSARRRCQLWRAYL